MTCRHDDLKEMLDSNKDSLKLEAMKRIVAVSVSRRAGWGWGTEAWPECQELLSPSPSSDSVTVQPEPVAALLCLSVPSVEFPSPLSFVPKAHVSGLHTATCRGQEGSLPHTL